MCCQNEGLQRTDRESIVNRLIHFMWRWQLITRFDSSLGRLQLSIDAQIHHLIPRIQSLSAGLTEIKNHDENLRLDGPAPTPGSTPPALAAGAAKAP